MVNGRFPIEAYAETDAPLAQLAEHLTLNQAVEGSIPSRRIERLS